MRKVTLSRRAENSLDKICKFIDSKNLPESSDKWLSEILGFIIEYAPLQIKYPLCKNKKLASQKLSCIIFKRKWVIAFKVTDKTFTVHQVLYGRNLR